MRDYMAVDFDTVAGLILVVDTVNFLHRVFAQCNDSSSFVHLAVKALAAYAESIASTRGCPVAGVELVYKKALINGKLDAEIIVEVVAPWLATQCRAPVTIRCANGYLGTNSEAVYKIADDLTVLLCACTPFTTDGVRYDMDIMSCDRRATKHELDIVCGRAIRLGFMWGNTRDVRVTSRVYYHDGFSICTEELPAMVVNVWRPELVSTIDRVVRHGNGVARVAMHVGAEGGVLTSHLQHLQNSSCHRQLQLELLDRLQPQPMDVRG